MKIVDLHQAVPGMTMAALLQSLTLLAQGDASVRELETRLGPFCGKDVADDAAAGWGDVRKTIMKSYRETEHGKYFFGVE